MADSKLISLKKEVAPYEQIDMRSSIRQICNTILPLLVLWYTAYASLTVSYWLSLVFMVMASGFVIRTFIIFHDCCHQSFLRVGRQTIFWERLQG